MQRNDRVHGRAVQYTDGRGTPGGWGNLYMAKGCDTLTNVITGRRLLGEIENYFGEWERGGGSGVEKSSTFVGALGEASR